MARWTSERLGSRVVLLAGAASIATVGLGTDEVAAADLLDADPIAAIAPQSSCDSTATVVSLATTLPLVPSAQAAKSDAILGGQPSALEQIRLTQEMGTSATSSDFAATDPLPMLALAPAAGGLRIEMSYCSQWVARPSMDNNYSATAGRGEFLASKRIEIGRTAFDSQWQRVRSERVNPRSYVTRGRNGLQDRLATLESVNRWVNASITYTEDRDLFGRADFWAGARKTLKLRRGDCEDIALTKMQLLAAAGIPRDDMILTIARDLVRNADHAVLIVRYNGRYLMLDNASDDVFDASASHDYRPILSFGASQKWLHGY